MKRMGVKFFFAAATVLSVLTIASQAQSQTESISGTWKGRYAATGENQGNSFYKGDLVLDLEVNGQEVTGSVYLKDDGDTNKDDFLDMDMIEAGTWVNGRLEIKWAANWKLTAELINNKLVGTYMYDWRSGNQYAQESGSFELAR